MSTQNFSDIDSSFEEGDYKDDTSESYQKYARYNAGIRSHNPPGKEQLEKLVRIMKLNLNFLVILVEKGRTIDTNRRLSIKMFGVPKQRDILNTTISTVNNF